MSIDTKHYKDLLLAEFDRIQEELASIGKKSESTGTAWDPEQQETETDVADREIVAENLETFETKESIIPILETEREEVSLALKKIEDGTYGVCEVCSSPIEDDRLNASPSARTCKAHMI